MGINDREFMIKSGSKIICENRFVLYDEIRRVLHQVSNRLLEMKTDLTKPVGIFLDRNEYLLLAMLSIIDLGGTYVPLDITYPSTRRDFIINDCNINTIITCKKYEHLFGHMNVICMDQLEEIDEQDEKQIARDVETSNSTNECIYIMYTSGTTGAPKGIEVTRRGVANFINGIFDYVDFSTIKRVACFTISTFDIFFIEGIIPVYRGLTVVLANNEERSNPKHISRLLIEHNVDAIQMTPSMLQMLLNYDKELSCLKNVKVIMVGGEPFPLKILQALQEKTNAKIYNFYGPTETSIYSTISDLTDKDHIDIGKPIRNTDIYLIDENGLILENRPGEIGIAGVGLAKGYLNNQHLTKQKFIYLPELPKVRIYLTGDQGKKLPDGNYDFLGRLDNQVKINGHRIELEEIESYLNQYPEIEQSLVIVDTKNSENKFLVAVYTSDRIIEDNNIKDFLLEKIPRYMVPIKYIKVSQFPLTHNGKIDRKQLSKEYLKQLPHMEHRGTIENVSTTANKVFEVIRENIKNIDHLSIRTDIMSIGVNSVNLIKIILKLEEVYKFQFDDEKLSLYAFETINDIVEYIDKKTMNE